jgi:hypothetical protein
MEPLLAESALEGAGNLPNSSVTSSQLGLLPQAWAHAPDLACCRQVRGFFARIIVRRSLGDEVNASGRLSLPVPAFAWIRSGNQQATNAAGNCSDRVKSPIRLRLGSRDGLHSNGNEFCPQLKSDPNPKGSSGPGAAPVRSAHPNRAWFGNADASVPPHSRSAQLSSLNSGASLSWSSLTFVTYPSRALSYLRASQGNG